MDAHVGIVGYRMGNIASLRNALVAIGARNFVAESSEQLREATHIILPGVGAFPKAMENLRALGFEGALRALALDEGRPMLGVCLGMQILASVGEEHGVSEGLGLIPGRVALLRPEPRLRVPHIGWNDTTAVRDNPLLGPEGAAGCFYYVHSYRFEPESPDDVIMGCDYGGRFAAGVRRRNVFGVQFHPEKSHDAGLGLLRAFLQVPPC